MDELTPEQIADELYFDFRETMETFIQERVSEDMQEAYLEKVNRIIAIKFVELI